jgi:hypothetical protein
MVPIDDVDSWNPKRFEKPKMEGPSLVLDTTEIKCLICKRTFKKPMIMARHFSLSHREKYVDKDSWREYFETVATTQTGDQT